MLCALVAAFYVRTGVAAMALMVLVLLDVPVPAARAAALARARRAAGGAAARRAGLDDRDARAARPDDRPPLGGGRPLRAGDGAGARAGRAEEQELVHTAGLLHDIGKFAFPDSILLADSRLTDEQWEQVKRHPEDGAGIVRRIDGYGAGGRDRPRPPRALGRQRLPARAAGEEIPQPARLIAVADTYDVITARDSYRKPVCAAGGDRRAAARRRPPARPATSWRSSSGCSRPATSPSRHGDDADFEAELGFGQRVHAHAQPLPRTR